VTYVPTYNTAGSRTGRDYAAYVDGNLKRIHLRRLRLRPAIVRRALARAR
jgi:hypothetical protein